MSLAFAIQLELGTVQSVAKLYLLRAWSGTRCVVIRSSLVIVARVHSFDWFMKLRGAVWLLSFRLGWSVEIVLGFLLDVAEIALPCAQIDLLVLVCCGSDCFVMLFQLLLSEYDLLLCKTLKVFLDWLRSWSVLGRKSSHSSSLNYFLSTAGQFIFQSPCLVWILRI